VASGSFAEALLEEGLGSPDAAARALARRTGLPLVDVNDVGTPFEATEAMPLRVLQRAVALPYAIEDDRLRIAIADPRDLNAIDELRLASRMAIELAVAPHDDILMELKRLSRASEMYGSRDAVEAEDDDAIDEDELEVEDGVSDGPLVRLVNSIIFQAAEDGASDVHFEPQEDGLVVRLRIDGVLHELQRVPRRMAVGVTTRLKVLAKLDIAERRKPQDGRISLNAKAAGRAAGRAGCDLAHRGRRVRRAATHGQVSQRADARGARILHRDEGPAGRDSQAADRRALLSTGPTRTSGGRALSWT
jgi:type IV pilus assembly protein PilB